MLNRWFGVIFSLLATSTASVFAHHAFAAEFDSNKPVTLKGAVVRMEWVNPHAWIYVDVKDSEGKVERWGIEAGAPNALLRRGFSKGSLIAGQQITVEGFRAKDGSLKANGRDLTFPDGKKLFMGTTGTGAPSDSK